MPVDTAPKAPTANKGGGPPELRIDCISVTRLSPHFFFSLNRFCIFLKLLPSPRFRFRIDTGRD